MSSSLIGRPIHSALCHIEAKSFVNYDTILDHPRTTIRRFALDVWYLVDRLVSTGTLRTHIHRQYLLSRAKFIAQHLRRPKGECQRDQELFNKTWASIRAYSSPPAIKWLCVEPDLVENRINLLSKRWTLPGKKPKLCSLFKQRFFLRYFIYIWCIGSSHQLMSTRNVNLLMTFINS